MLVELGNRRLCAVQVFITYNPHVTILIYKASRHMIDSIPLGCPSSGVSLISLCI